MADGVTVRDPLAPEPARALEALLETGPAQPGTLPPLWHWVYFLDRPRQSDLGPDGHPLEGWPTPPQPGLRRMFAGGRVTTHRLLRLDEPATLSRTASGPTYKDSRSGPLWFVTVRMHYEQAGETAVVEERDIVYRPQPAARTTPVGARSTTDLVPLDDAGAAIDVRVDEALLFRFSALTYNAHRIHYDLDWAAHEGYSGLVVHGPLQAVLMGELLRRTGQDLLGRTFAYRLVAPMVGVQLMRVRTVAPPDGAVAATRVHDAGGHVTAEGTLAAASCASGAAPPAR